jgi:hypothetical protein
VILAIIVMTLATSSSFAEVCDAMQRNDELPAGHFWDSEQAKKEYYKVEAGLDEAKEKLKQTQARLHTVRAVAAVAAIEYRSIGLNYLNKVLNPYWLPEGGKFEANYSNGYRVSHAPWQGCLVAVKVESEPVKAAVGFGRHKKRTGAYVHGRIEYSYTKWVSWYTPTGDVGMSAMERALRDKASPFASANPLYDKLMREVKQEVYALLAPLSRDVVLKFTPDLGPSNLDEIYFSEGEYKKDWPTLSWHALTSFGLSKIGGRYGLASYEGICWICHGKWEPYRFPEETLRNVQEQIARISDRLEKRINDAAWAVVAVEEEITALRRRQVKIRLLHYKPLIYKAFWSALQNTGRQECDEREPNEKDIP